MHTVTVRPAQRSDLVRLRSIFDSWHSGLVAVHGDSRGWLVADVGGVVVGGLLAREFCNWGDPLVGYGELTDDDVVPFAALMCVAGHMRGEGVGAQLVTRWIESTPSWAHVVMPDASDDEPSRTARSMFFERLGFRWIPTAHEGLEPWLMIRQTAAAPGW